MPCLRLVCVAGAKSGAGRRGGGGGRKARKRGKGKGAPAIRAGCCIPVHQPFSELIRECQLSICDQSQVGGFSAWSEVNHFVYRKLSSRDTFFQMIS